MPGWGTTLGRQCQFMTFLGLWQLHILWLQPPWTFRLVLRWLGLNLTTEMYFWIPSLHHPTSQIAPFRTLPCQAPAPTLPCQAPAPTLLCQAPAPSCQIPAPTLLCQAPAPTLPCRVPAPTLPCQAPAPTCQIPAPTLLCQAPAPTLPCQAPAPTLPCQAPAPTLLCSARPLCQAVRSQHQLCPARPQHQLCPARPHHQPCSARLQHQLCPTRPQHQPFLGPSTNSALPSMPSYASTITSASLTQQCYCWQWATNSRAHPDIYKSWPQLSSCVLIFLDNLVWQFTRRWANCHKCTFSIQQSTTL